VCTLPIYWKVIPKKECLNESHHQFPGNQLGKTPRRSYLKGDGLGRAGKGRQVPARSPDAQKDQFSGQRDHRKSKGSPGQNGRTRQAVPPDPRRGPEHFRPTGQRNVCQGRRQQNPLLTARVPDPGSCVLRFPDRVDRDGPRKSALWPEERLRNQAVQPPQQTDQIFSARELEE